MGPSRRDVVNGAYGEKITPFPESGDYCSMRRTFYKNKYLANAKPHYLPLYFPKFADTLDTLIKDEVETFTCGGKTVWVKNDSIAMYTGLTRKQKLYEPGEYEKIKQKRAEAKR